MRVKRPKPKPRKRQNWKEMYLRAQHDENGRTFEDLHKAIEFWIDRAVANEKEDNEAGQKVRELEADVLKQQAELAKLKAIKHSCHTYGQTHGAECHEQEL